jgi:lysyl-tRNA synthetase class 2
MEALAGAVGETALGGPDELIKRARELELELPEDATFGLAAETILNDLVEPELIEPTFIVDYPKDISPLAKERGDDPEIVERFEFFIGGLELGNSFSELNDPQEQRRRLVAQQLERSMGRGEAQTMDEDFVRALEHGMPPTGGLGIGFDRLVMLFTDSWNIRDVILFPTMRPEG